MADPLAGVWCHTPNAPGVQAIVCHSCTEMLEQIVGPVDKDRDSSSSGGGGGNGAPPKMITISCNSMTGIKGSAPFSVLEAEIRTQKRFPGAYMGETKGGGGSSSGESVFRRDLQSGSSDERTSNSTDPIVFAPPKKKKQQQHGKGKSRTTGKGQRRGCTRWTDEESEALLEAVEIHGDDAQAIKADPEFADRLDRRSGESIKQKMERENMFGDSSSDDDDDGENGSGDEGGAADGERGMEVENEVVAAAAITSTTSGAVGSVPLAGNQSGSSAVNKGKCTDGEKAQDVPVVRRDASEESAGVLNTKVGKAKQQSGTTTQLASASAGDVLASTVGAEKELEKEKEKEAEAAAVEEKETEMESGACTSRARGRLAKTAAASPLLLADDVSVASSHKSAASRATATSSSSTAAVLKRSSPRPTTSTEAATKGPTVGGGAGSAAATSCTTTAAGTSSKKAAALPPKVTVEHKPKGRNFELMALLSDSHRPPLPPRRQSKPTTSAPTQATRVAASVAVSDSESEESEESDDEADTIQVSRVLTRRQEQEQEQALVSTRSGKKLYLAGSDLLP